MRLSSGRSLRIVALSAAAAAGLAACGGSPPAAPASANQPPVTAEASAADLVPSKLIVPDGMKEGAFEAERTVLIPKGWSMSVFSRTPSARLATWTPDGKLLVSRPKEGQIDALTPSGSGAASSDTLLDGLDQPHGVAFIGDTLYVAESSRINAYTYARGQATGRRTIVDGLPDAKSAELGGQYAHALKSLAAGKDGALYYSIGSSGNTSEEDRSANPERATIWRVPPGDGTPEVFARGVRNGTGLAVAPDGSVWTAVNNRDNIQYPYPTGFGSEESAQGKVIEAYVADHPAELLAKLTPGRDLGWPYCNPEQDVAPGVAGTAYDYSEPPFINDQEMNPDGRKLDCARLAPIEQAFGAHSAPLGLEFATGLPAPYGDGALVGVHGSWNRTPPRAPEVSFFAYANGKLAGQQTLVGGFQSPDGKRWGRPVAATMGPDGAVYITDDSAPAVYRLAPPGR